MREIKFRGKSIETGEWIYGYYVYTHDRHRIIYEDYEGFYCEEEVDPETVGEYISLKDKNRCEIYEGDIVKFHFPNPYNTVVKFKNGHFAFYKGKRMMVDPYYYTNHVWSYAEVIGNIYENPELLDGENND